MIEGRIWVWDGLESESTNILQQKNAVATSM